MALWLGVRLNELDDAAAAADPELDDAAAAADPPGFNVESVRCTEA